MFETWSQIWIWFKVFFFPLKFHFFLSSSPSFIPNTQITAKLYNCFLPNASSARLFLVAHISLHLLAWCLGFLTLSQLLLLLLLSCPQLCQSVLQTIYPFETLLLWSFSTILAMVSTTGTLDPLISYSRSTASNTHLIPLRMPWTPFPCFIVFMLYWSVTPTCSPAAKFCITILEFRCTRHWEISVSASALIFWTCIRTEKHHISSHSSLKSVWTHRCPWTVPWLGVSQQLWSVGSIKLQSVQLLPCISTL